MSVSEAEKTARLFRRNIYNLLGRPLKAKTQYQHPATGQWKYKPLKRIEPSEFYAHLKGRTTIALCPIAEFATVVGRFALFVCWDIDERFRDRLDIMRQVLTGRGYAGGAFAVTGSDEGRGKVVLCLAASVPQAEAIAQARDILNECRSNLLWGPDVRAALRWTQFRRV